MLSDRLRPNVEAAQWVIDEVKELETELARLREAYRSIAIWRDGMGGLYTCRGCGWKGTTEAEIGHADTCPLYVAAVEGGAS